MVFSVPRTKPWWIKQSTLVFDRPQSVPEVIPPTAKGARAPFRLKRRHILIVWARPTQDAVWPNCQMHLLYFLGRQQVIPPTETWTRAPFRVKRLHILIVWAQPNQDVVWIGYTFTLFFWQQHDPRSNVKLCIQNIYIYISSVWFPNSQAMFTLLYLWVLMPTGDGPGPASALVRSAPMLGSAVTTLSDHF